MRNLFARFTAPDHASSTPLRAAALSVPALLAAGKAQALGQGRLVELGRALACRPRVLLLDEPASGQDETETARFGALLTELATDGTAVLLVEHDMDAVFRIADRITVMVNGSVVATGTPDQIRNDPVVRTARRVTSLLTSSRRATAARDRPPASCAVQKSEPVVSTGRWRTTS